MLNKWDHRFIDLSRLVATWSKDPSTKVGAVLTDGIRILSVGYNGFPVMMEDKDEWLEVRDEKLSRTVHGEINAILNAREPVFGTTLYVTPFLCCSRCAAMVAQAGIIRVVVDDHGVPERWKAELAKAQEIFDDCDVEVVYHRG